MKEKMFLAAVQSRVARISVGASTVRGRGNKGAVYAARSYFRTLNLSDFGTDTRKFSRVLDRKTQELLSLLPRGARHWGIARKLLNIFLRDCFYTTYLESKFKLGRIEEVLEIPLDSITAKHIKQVVNRGELPAWPGVKHVTPTLSAQFQDIAATEAAKHKVARIHLDAVWWSQSRD